jgi:hypothetical protein
MGGMEPESLNPFFVYLSFQEGEVLLNLNQVVMVREIGDEQMLLEMSSGSTVTVHGSGAVTRILGLLVKYSTIPEGVPLAKFLTDKEAMH